MYDKVMLASITDYRVFTQGPSIDLLMLGGHDKQRQGAAAIALYASTSARGLLP